MHLLSSHDAQEIFEKFAIGGKLGLVLTLFVLALVNGDTSHVVRKPRKFLLDAVFTGLAGASAACFLCYTRGRMDAAMSHCILALLFFFMFAVCREFSGYFSLLSGESLTARERKQRAAAGRPVMYFVGVCAVVAVVLAAMAHVAPPMETDNFVKEMLWFAAIITAADVWCAWTHGDSLSSGFLMGMGLYSAIHVILQAGGFYQHIYGFQ